MVARVLNTAWHKENLPWHRVVNGKGSISLKPGHGYELQKRLLKKEGIVFDDADCIGLEGFLWSP